jgi:peptidoglycan/LPS O-acetylase OafA/YrhL
VPATGTTLDTVHNEDGPPITQRTSGLGIGVRDIRASIGWPRILLRSMSLAYATLASSPRSVPLTPLSFGCFTYRPIRGCLNSFSGAWSPRCLSPYATCRSCAGRPGSARSVGLTVAIGGIAVVYLLLFRPDGTTSTIVIVLQMYFAFVPFIAVLLFCFARTWLSTVLSLPWILLRGEASYSIYLLHMGIVHFVQTFNLFAGTAAPTVTGWNIAHALVASVITVMIVIGLSLVSYSMIEVPARGWLRRWLTR